MRKLLEDLVKIESTCQNPIALKEAIELIGNQKTGWLHKRYLQHSKPSLVIQNSPGFAFDFILACHLDVVPAPKFLFRPRFIKGNLIGRGALDMKFAAAVYIKLISELETYKKAKIAFFFTTDEEVGGFDGTKYLVDLGYRSKVVLLPDGGTNMSFEQAEKGIWHIKLVSKGKPAHGSRPWLGKNAIDILIEAYSNLKKAFPNPKNEAWDITINAGKISGGTAVNVVAENASMEVDIRLPDEKKRSQVKNVLDGLKSSRLSYSTLIENPVFEIQKQNFYLKKYLNIARRHLGFTPKLEKSAGASDARFFAGKNIPVIITRPKGDGHHANNEFINLASLEQYYQIVKKFITT